MPSAGRKRIRSGQGGTPKWTLEEMHVLRLLNQDLALPFASQPAVFLAVFPYMRGTREYDASQLRDAWRHCHKNGRAKGWLEAVRPNKVDKREYTDEEKTLFAVYRGWIVAAAEATGVELGGLDEMEIEDANEEFLERMRKGLKTGAKEGSGDDADEVQDGPDEDSSEAALHEADEGLDANITSEAGNPAEGALSSANLEPSSSIRQTSMMARNDLASHQPTASSSSPVSARDAPRERGTKRRRLNRETESSSNGKQVSKQRKDAGSETAANQKVNDNRATPLQTDGQSTSVQEHPAADMGASKSQLAAQPLEATQAEGTQAETAPAANIVTTAAEPLPMVHWSHLTFQPDGVVYQPASGENKISAEEGFIDPTSAMYRYGGPVMMLTYTDDEQQQTRQFEAMICLKDQCGTCRPEHPVVVEEEHIPHSPFLGLPAVHTIDVLYTPNGPQFSQKPGRHLTSRDGWTFSARDKVIVQGALMFSDGRIRKVALCAGVDCSTCQSQAHVFLSAQGDGVYPGYQHIITVDDDEPRLIRTHLHRGKPFEMLHSSLVSMVNGYMIYNIPPALDGVVPPEDWTAKFGGPVHTVQIPDIVSPTGYTELQLQLCAKERCIRCSPAIDYDALPEDFLGPRAPTIHRIDCQVRDDGLLNFTPRRAREYAWIPTVTSKDVVFSDGKFRTVRVCAGPFGQEFCEVCRNDIGYQPPQQGGPLPMAHFRHVSKQNGALIFAPPPPSAGDDGLDEYGLVKKDSDVYKMGGSVHRVQYHVGGQGMDMQVCDFKFCGGCNKKAKEIPEEVEARLPRVLRRHCVVRVDEVWQFQPGHGQVGQVWKEDKEMDVVFGDGLTRKVLMMEGGFGQRDVFGD